METESGPRLTNSLELRLRRVIVHFIVSLFLNLCRSCGDSQKGFV